MLQDKVNANVSNVNKIIRHHAHPKTVGIGFSREQLGELGDGPDKFWTVNKEGADIKNLEMQSELIPAMSHIQMLRQAMFETTNSVDLASVKDKIGALTNFGLRILYSDALNKLNTKRLLYGDALLEIVRRLLVLNGMDDDPGEIVWNDPLPENEGEHAEALRLDVQSGFVSVPTASERRGYIWETEQERMSQYKNEQEANSDNIGAALLRNFVGNRTNQ
jgi:hypothetical protein